MRVMGPGPRKNSSATGAKTGSGGPSASSPVVIARCSSTVSGVVTGRTSAPGCNLASGRNFPSGVSVFGSYATPGRGNRVSIVPA